MSRLSPTFFSVQARGALVLIAGASALPVEAVRTRGP